MASHEFRTPISIFDAAAHRGERKHGHELPDRVSEKLMTIRGAVKRLSLMVNEIPEAERIQSNGISVEKAEPDIIALLKLCLNEQQSLYPRHDVQLRSDDLTHIECDSERLVHAFSNVLGNAFKYSASKPTVEINILRKGEDEVAIRVKDHGVCIPAAQVDRIGERFSAPACRT